MDIEKVAQNLKSVDLFKALNDAELNCILPFIQQFHFAKGEMLVKPGCPTKGLYLITQGKVSLSLQLLGDQTLKVDRLKSGEVFGDVSLLDCDPALSSVCAEADTRCYFLSQSYFRSFYLVYPAIGNKISRVIVAKICHQIRHAVEEVKGVLENVQQVANVKVSRKSVKFEPKTMSRSFVKSYGPVLKRLKFFKDYTGPEFDTLIKYFSYLQLSRGELLYKAGGKSIDACYFVVQGAVQSTVCQKEKAVKLAVYGPGKLVGLLSFFDEKPRMTTCVAREDVLLLCINHHDMLMLHRQNPLLYYRFYDILYSSMSDILSAAMRRLAWFMAKRDQSKRMKEIR